MKCISSTVCLRTAWTRFLPVFVCLAFNAAVRADTIDLVNGDHYSGTVLSVSLSNVSLRSEIQGLIVLPRVKVAKISFSPDTAKTNALPATAVRPSNTGTVLRFSPAPTPQTPVRTAIAPVVTSSSRALVGKVQSQVLAGAGPEAVQKYNEMATAFLGGTLSVPEIRKQAQETLKAVEQARPDLGPGMDDELESYLAILRQFLQQTAPK